MRGFFIKTSNNKGPYGVFDLLDDVIRLNDNPTDLTTVDTLEHSIELNVGVFVFYVLWYLTQRLLKILQWLFSFLFNFIAVICCIVMLL